MSVSIFFFLCHVKYSVVSLELVFTCWLSSIFDDDDDAVNADADADVDADDADDCDT